MNIALLRKKFQGKTTEPTFADILVKIGSLASLAAERHQHVSSTQERIEKIKSNVRALSRFFWFTIEFGLMCQNDKICAYGSGLLSSAGEIEHSITSPDVQRVPFQLEGVINQSFEIDRFQPLLFVINSFDHLYEEVNRLEKWLILGKLDNVAPGEPLISDEDLKEFM